MISQLEQSRNETDNHLMCRWPFQINFDPQLSGMFNHLSCTLILCDMLFNNGMYGDVVRTIQRRSEQGVNTNRFQNYILFAACYKLVSLTHLLYCSLSFETLSLTFLSFVYFNFCKTQNLPKDFDYALEVWKNCKKEHQLTQTVNFLAMLAINQKQTEKALEILPSIDKHFTSVNVRLLAHCECGQYAEAIEIIENQYKHHNISNVVVREMNITFNCKAIFSFFINFPIKID